MVLRSKWKDQRRSHISLAYESLTVRHNTWDFLFGISWSVDVGVQFGAISQDDLDIVVPDNVRLELFAVLVIPLLLAMPFLEQISPAGVKPFVAIMAYGRRTDWLE
jgi:hypothetical protein